MLLNFNISVSCLSIRSCITEMHVSLVRRHKPNTHYKFPHNINHPNMEKQDPDVLINVALIHHKDVVYSD